MKKFVKWVGIILGSLVLLLIIAAIVVPLIVDVDKYRPQMLQVANERINGKLDVGKLSLSLWGQIRVDVAGLQLADSKGRTIVSVQDAFFHVPFSSVLSGEPLVTLKMRSPEVNLIKDQNGKLNAMTLLKESALKAPAAPATQPSDKASSEVVLPAIVAHTRLGLELLQANLNYVDQATNLKTRVSDLNIVLKDMSLTRTTQLEAWASLDTKLGDKIAIRGPLRLIGAANPHLAGGKFEKLSTAMKIEADELEISVPGLFVKPKGVRAQVDLAISASEAEIRFERLNLNFHNAELKASGAISGLLTEGGAPSGRFEVSSNSIDLKPWQELVPLLQTYDPAGTIQLNAQASGPVSSLSYEANVEIAGISVKAPKLKARPTVNGKIRILTDRIDSIVLSMKAPGNDLDIQGKVISFLRPQADLVVKSSGMDLDQLIDFPPAGSAGGKQAGVQAEKTSAATAPDAPAPVASAKEDFDALLAPMREMPIMRALGARAVINIKSMKAYDVRMTDMTAAIGLRDLNASIERFSMKLWKGSVAVDGAADLAKKMPTYRFSTNVSQLDLGEAVASQLQLFKNTVVGKADFQMSGEGASFNPEPAMKNLKARGKLGMRDAAFASIDVAKMISEALNRALEKVGEKVPQLKGKTLQPLPGRESRYELISSDVIIADGKFSAPNFVGKAAPNKGIDLNGNTTVGMLDKSISADWTLIDTYNLTRGADLSVEIAGTRVERVLAESGKPLKLPVHVGCTLAAPCYSYTQVPEHLAKVAAANVARAAEGRAKEELRKRAAPLLDKAPPAVQKGLDEIRKKLFR